MPTIIYKLLAPLAPYLAAAVIFLCGILYTSHLRHNLAAANAANIALVQTNRENAAAITAYKAQAQKWNTALDTLDAQTLATHTAASRILDAITDTPASADAPIATVLANALAEIGKLQDQQK